jgi:hypothetical protein
MYIVVSSHIITHVIELGPLLLAPFEMPVGPLG